MQGQLRALLTEQNEMSAGNRDVKPMVVRFKAREHLCEINAGAGIIDDPGPEVRRILGPATQKIAIISNPTVSSLFGRNLARSLRKNGFQASEWLMGDGEHHKNLRALEQALQFLSAFKLTRTDAVLSLGGGVVGDLAGLAAALHLRGVRLMHAPTTLVAQIDAAIGGKTAVNTDVAKNVIGAFHQPVAVWIDPLTLNTLPARELTSGWCEALKQGAAGSSKLFRDTHSFLRKGSVSAGPPAPSLQLLMSHCRFKATIVSRDEREDTNRGDHKSRRILNFGHTTAHALEAVSNYRRLRHGEAVGYGMLVAGEISTRLGLLPHSELELLRDAVRLCGHLPHADNFEAAAIIEAIRHDKKQVGGETKWVLLERIGRARIVDGREISPSLLRASLKAGLRPND
jgi:3-dehydroquinate synthase